MHFFDFHSILFSEAAASWRIVLAAVFGIALGLERSIAGKHAGMRTYGLVAIGSCLFTVIGTLATYQFAMFSSINPLQLAGSVIIGIGFVGTGLAMFHDSHPVELTTAAGIFVAAGVGMAVGFGFIMLSAVTVVVSLIVLRGLTHFEHAAQKRFGDGTENGTHY